MRSDRPTASAPRRGSPEWALARRWPAGPRDACRVESRTGAVAWAMRQHPVSRPRSSNRTCGFPASGFPTGFTPRHTAAAQDARVEDAARRALRRPDRRRNALCRALAPCAACEGTHERDHRRGCRPPIGRHSRAVAEIGRPAEQKPVQPVAHLGPWFLVAGHQDVADLRLDPLYALLGRARAQVPMAVLPVALRTERVTKEVEAFRAGILHRGLRLVERQPKLRYHH